MDFREQEAIRKRLRGRLLLRIYEETGANKHAECKVFAAAKAIGLEGDESLTAYQNLLADDSLELINRSERIVQITYKGIRRAEANQEDPPKNLDETIAARSRFLGHVYGKTAGNAHKEAFTFEIGKELGFDEDASKILVSYLEHCGLVKTAGISLWKVSMTPDGLTFISDGPAGLEGRVFYATINLIVVRDVVNSILQVGGAGAKLIASLNVGEQGHSDGSDPLRRPDGIDVERASRQLPGMSVKPDEATRELFLQSLYDRANGRRTLMVRPHEIGHALGINYKESDAIAEYLDGEGLIERVADDYVKLTHLGVKHVETGGNPLQPSNYMGSVTNNITVQGNMTGTMQLGGHAAQLTSTTTNNYGDVEAFLTALKKELPNLTASEVDRSDLSVDIETVERQLQHSTPKKPVIVETLKAIRSALTKMAGAVATSAIATTVKDNLPALLAWCGQLIEKLGG